jgi:parallel beta-helix repeat protein
MGEGQMRKVILLAVVLLSASLVCGAKLLGPVTTQSPTHSYPKDFPGQTLDQAIHNETVNEGDTIIVKGGTYPEHLNVNKSITLSGGYQGDTILDGGGNGTVVEVFAGNVTLDDFTVRNGVYGIRIDGFGHTLLENISIVSNDNGISIVQSASNILRTNTLSGNHLENFGISGLALQDFIQDIDTSNTINGKPIYYRVNMTGGAIPVGGGYVAVVNSTNVKVKNLNLGSNYQGVLLAYTTNSTVENNTLSHDSIGIQLCSSTYNEIISNSLTNDRVGLSLQESSDNNTIVHNDVEKNGEGISFGVGNYSSHNIFYRNNFIQNWYGQIDLYNTTNFFNNSREGNYWDTYKGSDLDLDGVGDTMTPCESVDYRPLMEPWQIDRTLSCMRYGMNYYFTTLSNSTVARLSKNWNGGLRRIGFNITSGTAESINITIPRNWIDGPFEIQLNGTKLEPSSFSANQDDSNSYIFLDYNPGTYMVGIIGARVYGYLSGDINNDGVVNILDAIILSNYFLGVDPGR